MLRVPLLFIWVFLMLIILTYLWLEMLIYLLLFVLNSNSVCLLFYIALYFEIAITFFSIIISVAYFTLAERKIMGAIQRRKGPDINGIWGIFQPLIDALKLILKEIIIPKKANSFFFLLSPILTLFISFNNWIFIPFSFTNYYTNFNLSLLYVLAISSIGVYGIFLSGWSSNSKYALLGSIRSINQIISYEVCLSLIIILIVLLSGSLNLINIVYFQWNSWFFFPLFPMALLFFICSLAETNRSPFDLPEAEAELVAGFNIDYSSILFAMFFLAEYSNILLISSLNVIFFFGGWFLPILDNYFIYEFLFSIKIIIYSFLFVWVRSTLPRYRFDQLLDICWKQFLPFILGYLLFISGIFFYLDILPFNGTNLFINQTDFIYLF